MAGPLGILADIPSATHGRPRENDAHHILALKRRHSELVKFSRNDVDYARVLAVLKRMTSAAISAIPRGMSSIKSTDD